MNASQRDLTARNRRPLAGTPDAQQSVMQRPLLIGLSTVLSLRLNQAQAQEPPTAPQATTPPPLTTTPTAAAPFADFTWLPGNARTTESPLSGKAFTGEFRVDTAYHYSFSQPKDDTMLLIKM